MTLQGSARSKVSVQTIHQTHYRFLSTPSDKAVLWNGVTLQTVGTTISGGIFLPMLVLFLCGLRILAVPVGPGGALVSHLPVELPLSGNPLEGDVPNSLTQEAKLFDELRSPRSSAASRIVAKP